MKKLIIVRHAKSLAAKAGETDFERGLTESGKADALEMGKRFHKDHVKIDAFVSSPAKRAKKTCKAFCEAYGKDKDEIIYIDSLYHAPSREFYRAVSSMDNSFDSVAVFAHNPGITDFVNTLCEKVQIDNMPKSGVFAVQADIESWADFEKAEKVFLFFKYPGMG